MYLIFFFESLVEIILDNISLDNLNFNIKFLMEYEILEYNIEIFTQRVVEILETYLII